MCCRNRAKVESFRRRAVLLIGIYSLSRKLTVRDALQCVHLHEKENKKFERQHAAKKEGRWLLFFIEPQRRKESKRMLK